MPGLRSPAVLLAAALAGCTTQAKLYDPPAVPGVALQGPIMSAPGRALRSRDLSLPPGAIVPQHYHAGEEFVYVIEGDVTLRRKGMPDLVMRAGDGLRIAPGTVHSAEAGDNGFRAIATYVLIEGEPERTPVD
ncbi:cupin domain-containing protein [Altererythrobacter arenosus]|uniref:Cupin domain-containing protein n=1 Tax=Altererythrobacter arenosus TaxID=3032592 RepID=A0ABY8FXK2_9SPHN|nr:cupin domain-containing protein [Altererythrobacter sp. CAU 1644]WFL78800.1 cupin domain-containing protein [Altererythrobacter sp. CAU 1644]